MLIALPTLVILILIHGNRCYAGESTPPLLDVLENESEKFVCQYNQSIDAEDLQELSLFVQNCSDPVPSVIPVNASKISAAALSIGKVTGSFRSYRQRFPDLDSPVLNERHPLVANGIVSLLAEFSNSGRVTIGVGSMADGMCVICAQSGRGDLMYSETKRAKVRKLGPPTVRLSVNGIGMDSQHQVLWNTTLLIACNVFGHGGVTARLFKDDRLLHATLDEAVHEIGSTAVSNSGQYRCDGISDMEQLKRKDKNFATTNFTLIVKFPPVFDATEIVRYTEVGQKEDIQLSVQGFPEPKVVCQSDQAEDGLVVREGFDYVSYYSKHRVVFSNLDAVRKVTVIRCHAENNLGRHNLSIILTAKAPRPVITSQQATEWWNSYHLSWQHDTNASVDQYQIRIVYLKPNGGALKTTKKTFDPKAKLGHVAKVSTEDDPKSGRRHHNGVVFDLMPDAPHEISLQSCNRHGCSDFSDPVRVQTAVKSPSTFNDPINPQYRAEEKKQAVESARIRASLIATAVCCHLTLRAMLLRGN